MGLPFLRGPLGSGRESRGSPHPGSVEPAVLTSYCSSKSTSLVLEQESLLATGMAGVTPPWVGRQGRTWATRQLVGLLLMRGLVGRRSRQGPSWQPDSPLWPLPPATGTVWLRRQRWGCGNLRRTVGSPAPAGEQGQAGPGFGTSIDPGQQGGHGIKRL